MARTQTRRTRTTRSRTSGKKENTPKANIIRSSSERRSGSGRFIRLNTDEKFEGYVLFNPNPELEDNPGYVEYEEHWDTSANRFVPCWGKKNGCIFCKAGMQPSTRALVAFLVTSIDGEALKTPEIKLFRMNWSMIQEWTDELDEEGELIGKKVRITCMSREDGNYKTRFLDKEKPLTKKALKENIDEIPEIEAEIQRNLDSALQAMRVSSVLDEDDDEDDDDDDDEPKSSKKTSSRRSKKDDDDEEDEDDDNDNDEGEEDDEDEDDEEDGEDDDDDDDADEDEEDGDDEDDEDDEDEDDDEDEEDESDDDDEDEDSKLEGTFTVVSTNESEATFTVKEVKQDLYFNEDIVGDVEFDDFKKGDKIVVKAEKDEDDDWVITEFKKAKGGTTKKPPARRSRK